MKRIFIAILTATIAMYGTVSCNKSSDSSPSGETTSTTSYQGAGSKWSISFTGTSFVLSKFATAGDASAAIVVNGNFEKFDNQFVKMTVTSATGTGAPSAGDVAYGLEVPGYAFFLKPLGSAAEPIVMVQAGSCPSSSFDANWVIAKVKTGFTTMSATSDTFGGAAMTMNGASSSLSVSRYQPLTGAALSGNATMNFDIGNCSSGLLRVVESASNGTYFDMYFTSSGGALVKFPEGQIIFASPKQTTAVTQASIAGTYSAVVFADKAGGDSVFPAKLTIPASGTGTGVEITTVSSDTVSTDGVTFSNISTTIDSTATQLPLGFFRADLNSTGATTNGKVSCAVSTISTTKVIACSGYMNNTGTDAYKPFFFLARSR